MNITASRSCSYIREQLENMQFINRSELARFLCKHFSFSDTRCYDTRDEEQLSGCLKALWELETAGQFALPAARKKTGRSSPKRLSDPVAAAVSYRLPTWLAWRTGFCGGGIAACRSRQVDWLGCVAAASESAHNRMSELFFDPSEYTMPQC